MADGDYLLRGRVFVQLRDFVFTLCATLPATCVYDNIRTNSLYALIPYTYANIQRSISYLRSFIFVSYANWRILCADLHNRF